MAYTSHVLVAFGGTWVDTPGEVWENTVRISSNGGGGVTLDPGAYITAIKTALSTWFTNSATKMSSSAVLGWLKANTIGSDGKYVDKTTTHLWDYAAGIVGAQAPVGPQFLSLAYTWETAAARGPAHRGRIYPPNAGYGISTAFEVNSSQRDANAAAGAALLTVLKNAGGTDGTKGTPVIASNIGAAIQNITGCTSDTVFDVQRRRKNRVKGTRSSLHTF
jgi:hypothetical protein